jgi:hypothetical protein
MSRAAATELWGDELDHWRNATPPPGTRRTVVIRGQVAPPPRRVSHRTIEERRVERRRPPKRAYERLGARPDRAAYWAVLMGLFLILVAAASGHIL